MMLKGVVAALSTAAKARPESGKWLMSLSKGKSARTTMYPNIMWKSSCRFVHRVPLLGLASSSSLADSSNVWKVARASSYSERIARRSGSAAFNAAQIARSGARESSTDRQM